MNTEELITAVKEGDLNRVRAMIQPGADVNVHGSEQEWTPLNYAAGKGDLAMIKLLVESGANVFEVGRDNRTPYLIALAAGQVEAARYLKAAEEQAGGDQQCISSRSGERRPYCKGYELGQLRRFPGWSEKEPVESPENATRDETEKHSRTDESVVFIHQDFTVTESIWHGEHVVFEEMSPEWKAYCAEKLDFRVPTDFDLVPPQKQAAGQE